MTPSFNDTVLASTCNIDRVPTVKPLEPANTLLVPATIDKVPETVNREFNVRSPVSEISLQVIPFVFNVIPLTNDNVEPVVVIVPDT